MTGGGRLEAVVAVVAVEHQDRAVRDRALEVALEKPVGLLLAFGELHRVRELQLGLAIGAFGLPLGDHLVQRPAEARPARPSRAARSARDAAPEATPAAKRE